MIRIRETTDILDWKKTHDKVFKEPWYAYDIEFYWLAYVDGEVAGFASMALFKDKEGWGYFTRAGVLPKFRGMGIHHKLISVRKRCAKKLGMKGIVTYAHKSNYVSINHLYRSGFKMYEPKENWLEDWTGDFLYFVLEF